MTLQLDKETGSRIDRIVAAVRRAVSEHTLRPGETKGCRGCHDKTDGNHHPYQREDTEAWRHGVQTLQPFGIEVFAQPNGFEGFEQLRLIVVVGRKGMSDRGDDHDVAGDLSPGVSAVPVSAVSVSAVSVSAISAAALASASSASCAS